MVSLPDGFACGHATDTTGSTGCTAILAPPGSVGAGEVRGGGPGTRESDLLSAATSTPGPEAFVLAGGSARGLAAADGAADWLLAAGRGFETPGGRVPLVSAAVLYDLLVGSPDTVPDAAMGRTACEAAGADVARGSVGAGAGCSVGKLLGPDHATKGGIGAATLAAGGVTLTAVAAVNAVGDVLSADGSILAGAWRDGAFARATDLVLEDAAITPPLRTSTTLVCVCTDARLTKLEAFLVARAASAGVARAVSPCATAWDGDLACCLASGVVTADPTVVGVLAAEACAAAIRDAIAEASGVPGCPSATDRSRG